MSKRSGDPNLNDFQRAMLDAMDPIERAAFDAQPEADKIAVMAMHTGKGFKSGRVPDMEIDFRYARGIAAAAIALAVEERFAAKYANVKPSVSIPHFNVPEAAALSYMHTLLTGAAQAYMRDGDTVVRVDPRSFRDPAVIEALHRGEKITARVTHRSLIVDAPEGAVSVGHFDDLAADAQKHIRLTPKPTQGIEDETGHVWEMTARIFLLEDKFRAAVATDLPEIDPDDVPLPQGWTAGITSSVKFGEANAVVIEPAVQVEPEPEHSPKKREGRPDLYVGMGEAVNKAVEKRRTVLDDGSVIWERFRDQDEMVAAVRPEYAPQLQTLRKPKRINDTEEPDRQTIINWCMKHPNYNHFKSLRSKSK